MNTLGEHLSHLFVQSTFLRELSSCFLTCPGASYCMCYTLHALMQDEDMFLKNLREVIRVHGAIIENWSNDLNWRNTGPDRSRRQRPEGTVVPARVKVDSSYHTILWMKLESSSNRWSQFFSQTVYWYNSCIQVVWDPVRLISVAIGVLLVDIGIFVFNCCKTKAFAPVFAVRSRPGEALAIHFHCYQTVCWYEEQALNQLH